MTRYYLQTKKTSLSYGISDTETTMRLTALQKLDGTSISAADIGDYMTGTFDPGTSKEEIFSIASSGVTVNADGTVDITGVVRGLREGGTAGYSTGGYSAEHGAGAVVVFSNNPQLYNQLANKSNDNTFTGQNIFNGYAPQTNTDPVAGNDLTRLSYVQALVLGTLTSIDVVVPGTAGETIADGNLIYLNTDNKWYKTDADTASTVNNVLLGIAKGAGATNGQIANGVLLQGVDNAQSGLTGGQVQYASNTAGAISNTPGTTEVTVGVAKSATELYFSPRFNQMLTEDQQDALAGNNGNPSATNLFMTQSGYQIGAEVYAADAGSNDTYVITLSPVPSAYVTGMTIRFKANTINTGTATLNVNSLGAKTIVKGVNTTLSDGDILAGQFCTVIYDGTNFVLQNPVSTNIAQPSITPTITATIFETAGRFSASITATGVNTFNSNGLNQVSGDGTGAGGSSKVLWALTPVASTLYTGSPLFKCRVVFSSDQATGSGSTFWGLGEPTVATSGHTYTVGHTGFKTIKSGGVVTLYATQADGTTETASSALTTLVNGDYLELSLKINGTSSVDYYWRKNGGALSSATNLTTNMPSGTSSNAQFSCSSNSTSLINTYYINSASYER